MPSDIIGVHVFDRARAEVRVPPGAAVRGRPADGRGEPRRPEDPVGAARGDGRAPGDGRARAAAAVRPVSSSSRRRTRTSSRAPIRCPSRSSTASCCASTSPIRRPRTRRRSSRSTAPTMGGAAHRVLLRSRSWTPRLLEAAREQAAAVHVSDCARGLHPAHRAPRRAQNASIALGISTRARARAHPRRAHRGGARAAPSSRRRMT